MAQRCIKCRRKRKTKKGMCVACRPWDGTTNLLSKRGKFKNR